MPASIHSSPSWFLIRKYCPFLQAPVDVGIHTENTFPIAFSAICSHPHSLIYRCPVTDISRSSSTLTPAATRCLSPRWHSIIFISWDEHGSLHLHLLARCLTLIFFLPSWNSWINPTWLWCINLLIASSFSLLILSGSILRDIPAVSLAFV